MCTSQSPGMSRNDFCTFGIGNWKWPSLFQTFGIDNGSIRKKFETGITDHACKGPLDILQPQNVHQSARALETIHSLGLIVFQVAPDARSVYISLKSRIDLGIGSMSHEPSSNHSIGDICFNVSLDSKHLSICFIKVQDSVNYWFHKSLSIIRTQFQLQKLVLKRDATRSLSCWQQPQF